MTSLHVVPHGDRWAVKRPSSDRPISHHRTQGDAVTAAHEFALALGFSDVLVDGRRVVSWPPFGLHHGDPVR